MNEGIMLNKIIKEIIKLRKDVKMDFNPEHIAYNGALTDVVKVIERLKEKESHKNNWIREDNIL